MAAWTLPIAAPAEDFGWVSIALVGITILASYACLCVAVWGLPRRRSVVLAAVAGLIAVGVLAAAIPLLSDVDARPAVWIVGLGLLTSIAIAVVASQRVGMAWLAMVGGGCCAAGVSILGSA